MMKIIVCLKEVIDPKLNLDFGLTNRVIFREGRPLKLEPNDAASLAMALNLKCADKDSQIEITLISIGPERVEHYLRSGLALGADKAVRIWDEGFQAPSPYCKARLLTRAVSILGADLIFTGARSLDIGNGQTGIFMAAWLGLPCVSDVVSLELDKKQNTINLLKDIGRGEREKIQCCLPALITVKGDGRNHYASLDRLIESKSAEVKFYSPSDLGLSPADLKKDPATVTDLIFPGPAPRKAPPLDSSLPAFYRILQLLEGGLVKRKGLMLQGSSDELAERLFELLKEAGVIRSAENS